MWAERAVEAFLGLADLSAFFQGFFSSPLLRDTHIMKLSYPYTCWDLERVTRAPRRSKACDRNDDDDDRLNRSRRIHGQLLNTKAQPEQPQCSGARGGG